MKSNRPNEHIDRLLTILKRDASDNYFQNNLTPAHKSFETMNKLTKKIIKSALVIMGLSMLLLAGSHNISRAAEDQYVITWEIDRSKVPIVPFQELTIAIAVGDASEVVIKDENGEELPFVYDADQGVVKVTTTGNLIELSFFTNTVGNPLVGSYAPTALKDDYLWAWSHGIDDNANIEGTIEKFEERGWRGTLYLIGVFIDRPWAVRNLPQQNRIRQLLADGWSLGNHTYSDVDCDLELSEFEDSILDNQERLNELIRGSERPDYLVSGFAAPCFLAAYHPAVLELRRSSQASLIFNESGDRLPIILDAGSQDEILDDQQIFAYDDELAIGRDGEIDEGELDSVIGYIDWIARNSNESRHLWYNTLSHGERGSNTGVETRIGALVEYVYRTYGPLGTNEVWVAPADQIVSYVKVRDYAELKVAGVIKNSESVDRTTIRLVAADEVGNLDSSGFLPTVERIADTPIPIVIEAAAPATSTPLPPTETPIPTATATPVPVTPTVESDEVAAVVDQDSGIGEPSETTTIFDTVDEGPFKDVSPLIGLILLALLIFGFLVFVALAFLVIRYRRSRK